ncbi:MAG: helix-turn-helix domain-containing protein [Anaerolineae bacterium]|nr:helix-turn-helix domain-containing protein [Anaerolineae bacterium]NUQ05968.1 helix-turn-helix transcriptional regulator [Anaerolineae bacterium]
MSNTALVFGQRLRQQREKLAFTQQDVADQLNINYQQLNKWEAGKHLPAAETIAKLAVVLQTSSDYLLNLTSDPEQRTAQSVNKLTPEEREIIEVLRQVRKASSSTPG